MRIIAGTYRSRRLLSPPGRSARPTTDRVRESVFTALTTRLDLKGLHILDLFAGSGALGLEALSRGAAAVTFVESDSGTLTVCRKNAQSLDVEGQCRFVRAPTERFIERYRGPGFDLLFADPPYDWPGTASFPDSAIPVASEKALLVLEHDSKHEFQTHPRLLLSKKYGRTHVSLFVMSKDVGRER
jgi:16S rRNA (guanine(966)-N(2))-methyltransferase RsmD